MATTWTKTGHRSGRAVQSNNESEPLSSVPGLDLDDVEGLIVVVQAPPGQTFDGTGSMLGYRSTYAAWVRAPRADIDMADFTGLSAAAFPAFAVEAPIGRFIFSPSNVGLSGGTTITTDYLCSTRNGRQA